MILGDPHAPDPPGVDRMLDAVTRAFTTTVIVRFGRRPTMQEINTFRQHAGRAIAWELDPSLVPNAPPSAARGGNAADGDDSDEITRPTRTRPRVPQR